MNSFLIRLALTLSLALFASAQAAAAVQSVPFSGTTTEDFAGFAAQGIPGGAGVPYSGYVSFNPDQLSFLENPSSNFAAYEGDAQAGNPVTLEVTFQPDTNPLTFHVENAVVVVHSAAPDLFAYPFIAVIGGDYRPLLQFESTGRPWIEENSLSLESLGVLLVYLGSQDVPVDFSSLAVPDSLEAGYTGGLLVSTGIAVQPNSERIDIGNMVEVVFASEPEPEVMSVDIEVLAATENGCIIRNSRAVIPVAILGSEDLDVQQIDTTAEAAEPLSLNGLGVKVNRHNSSLCAVRDTNWDGFADLVCLFNLDSSQWAPGVEQALALTGSSWDGMTLFEGNEMACVEAPSERRKHFGKPKFGKHHCGRRR